jgi:hypothetical protein
MATDPLREFEMLLENWRNYLQKYPAVDDMSRHSGFHAALSIAMEQVSDALTRAQKAWDAGE